MQNVVIICNQTLFVEGFKLLLTQKLHFDFRFIERSFKELVSAEKSLLPDIIIIYLEESNLNDLGAFKKLRRQNKSSRLIVISKINNTKIVREAFQNSIDGYILLNTESDELKKAIDLILTGDIYMSEGLKLTPGKGEQKNTNHANNHGFNGNSNFKQKLTKRENEVLALIVMAKSNKEIGTELFISEQTVGVHKKNIMRKLGVHNTVSLIRFAIDNNLI